VRILRPDGGMSQVGMVSGTASTKTVASRGLGLLFVEISDPNVMPDVHKTDLDVSGQKDASFG
jgi:hypothetical protein